MSKEKYQEVILVSSCFYGNNCKYDAGNNYNPKLIEDLKDFKVVLICPETLGKLSSPRNPSEIIGDKVFGSDGRDVTKEYFEGARLSCLLAKKYQVRFAILKAKSPSCGAGLIYDGTFSHTVIPGDGITSRELKKLGVQIYNENNYQELINLLKNEEVEK